MRLLVLAVCAGWGVTVGNFTKKIKLIMLQAGCVYFLVSAAAELQIQHLNNLTDSTERLQIQHQVLMSMGIQTVMDAVLVFIILTLLGKHMQKFKETGESDKFKHYNKFSKCIAILTYICCLHMTFLVFLQLKFFGDREGWFIFEHFEWMIVITHDFYHGLYVSMLAVIMMLWRPNKSSKLYAYVKQLPTYVQYLYYYCQRQ